MAASDLTQAIVSDPGSLGSAWESRAATAFLQQLGDPSIDVQANAVRCVSRVLLYFLPESVRLILESLASAAADGSIASLDGLYGGDSRASSDVQQDCLELVADIFSFSGGLREANLFEAAAAKETQLSLHLTHLLHAKPPTARRAARCLGGLAACLPSSELEELLVVLVSASPLTPAPLEALGEVCRCCSSSSSSKSVLVQFLNPLCCYLTQVLACVLAAEAAASGGSFSVAAAAAAAAHAADAAKASLATAAAAAAADTSSRSSRSSRLEQHIPADVVLPRGATPETMRAQREELLEAALAALAAAARICCCAAAAKGEVFAAAQPLLLPLLSYNPNVYTAETPEQQQQQQQQELKQLLLLQQQPRDQQLVLQLLQARDTSGSSSSSSSSSMEDLDFDPGCSYDEHFEDPDNSWRIRMAAFKANPKP
ncbi:hypothetical protein Emag_001632 [Eimeria magna]